MERHSKFLLLSFKVANQFNSVLIKWDPKAQRMSVSSSYAYQKSMKYKRLLHDAFTFVHVAGGVFSLALGAVDVKNTSNLILLFLSLITSITGYNFQSVLQRNAHEFCVFVNGLGILSKNLKSNPTKLNLLTALNEIVAYMLLLSAILHVPTIVFGFHFLNPCKPSLMGYWLLPQCWSTQCSSAKNVTNTLLSVVALFQKILLLVTNYWMVGFGINAGPLAVGYLMILCTVSLHDCLNR